VKPIAVRAVIVLLAACISGGVLAQSEGNGPAGETQAQPQVLVPGEYFLPREIRAKQSDDFDNPGFPVVQAGEAAWKKPEGAAGKSCGDCHGAKPEQRIVAAVAGYPKYAGAAKRVITLQTRINICREAAMQAPVLAEGSDRMMAMSAFLRWSARGLPAAADVSGPAGEVLEQGKSLYFKKMGLLQLSCSDCHDQNFGQKYGGETLSQGHGVAYPVYSMAGKRMVSLHERLRLCNGLARAEPQAEGSPDYVALELYLNWRSKGLPVTAPGVRP
jgi:L-cysteine S-thiosulfotransferase